MTMQPLTWWGGCLQPVLPAALHCFIVSQTPPVPQPSPLSFSIYASQEQLDVH